MPFTGCYTTWHNPRGIKKKSSELKSQKPSDPKTSKGIEGLQEQIKDYKIAEPPSIELPSISLKNITTSEENKEQLQSSNNTTEESEKPSQNTETVSSTLKEVKDISILSDETLEELKQKLIALYIENGEIFLSHILKQSVLKTEGTNFCIIVASGHMNEDFEKEKLKIKHFLIEQLNNREFELEIREGDFVPQMDIPYSFKDKVNKMIGQNPEIEQWFSELDLKQDE